MKNFINISDLSSKELRSIIEEAKTRKLNRKILTNLLLITISHLRVNLWQ